MLTTITVAMAIHWTIWLTGGLVFRGMHEVDCFVIKGEYREHRELDNKEFCLYSNGIRLKHADREYHSSAYTMRIEK